MDLPSNPETTPGMDGKGRLDLDRFLFGMAFVPIFSQNVYIISKKHKSPKIKIWWMIFSTKNYQINSRPNPGPFGTSHPPKAGGLISDATLRPVAKSMNFVSTQPKCSSQISLFFFGLNKGKVKDLGAS